MFLKQEFILIINQKNFRKTALHTKVSKFTYPYHYIRTTWAGWGGSYLPPPHGDAQLERVYTALGLQYYR